MKRIILASILIVTMIMIGGFTTTASYAIPMEGDQSTTDYIDTLVGSDGNNYYCTGVQTSIQYNKDGSTKPFVHENYDGPRKHYLIKPDEQGNYYGYCIEQGISYPDAQRYQGVSWGKDNYFTHLPKEVRTGIMLATIFGRQPGKSVPVPGCNDDDWYWATQVIIWEYQQQLRQSPTKIQGNGHVPATFFQSTLKGRPAEKCYNYMLAAMANYSEIPSFTADSQEKATPQTLKWDSGAARWSLTLKDDNQIGDQFRFDDSLLQVEKSGNSYTFSTKTKTSFQTIEFKKNISLPSHELLIWGSATGTQSIATGTADPIKFYMTFRTEQPGTFILQKTSEDGVLTGFDFLLTDSNGITFSSKTNESGKINLQLFPGQYKVTEADSSKYRTPKEANVIITENNTTNIEIANTLKKGQIQLQKNVKDTISNVSYGEDGAVFQIYDSKYESFQQTPQNARDEMQTNALGKAISKELPLGDYVVHQTKAGNHISLSKDVSVSINKDMEIVLLPLENYLLKGKIEIVKTDPNSKKLEGAVFSIRTAEDFLNYDGTVRFKKGSAVATIISDKNGVASTDWLCPGKYLIQEVKAPTGYLVAKNPVTEVQLTSETQESLTFVKQVIIKNQPEEAKEEFPLTGENSTTAMGKTVGALMLSLIGMAILTYNTKKENKTLR